MREWLKQRRTEQHLTGAELGRRLGISESYYFLIESGKRQNPMMVDMAVKIATALHLDPMQVIRWEIS